MKCEVCEKEFERDKLRTLSLGNDLPPNDRVSNLCCETCELQVSVSFYRIQLEKSKGQVENLKTQLNLFKSVMLQPNTMAAIADEPMTDQPSMMVVRKRLSGIENFTIDQMQFWLETYELYARYIAEHLGKKASKEELKAHLQEKTKKEFERQKEAKKKLESVESKPRVKLSAEDKAVQVYMKTLNLTEEAAKELISNMMKGVK